MAAARSVLPTGDLEQYLVANIRTATSSAAGVIGSLKSLGKSRIKKIAGKASLSAGEIGGEVETRRQAEDPET